MREPRDNKEWTVVPKRVPYTNGVIVEEARTNPRMKTREEAGELETLEQGEGGENAEKLEGGLAQRRDGGY